MNKYKFELSLAAVLIALFVGGLAFWGDWGGGKMSRQEVDDYLVIIDENLEWPEPMKSYMMASLQEWGYADDGEEFMMITSDGQDNQSGTSPEGGTAMYVPDHIYAWPASGTTNNHPRVLNKTESYKRNVTL